MARLKHTQRVLSEFWGTREPEDGRGSEDQRRFGLPIGIALTGEGQSANSMDEPTLIDMIEGEIIPRLLLSHRGETPAFVKGRVDDDADAPIVLREGGLGTAPVGRRRFAEIADCDQFARLLIDHDVELASRYVDVLRYNLGISDSAILLELLAPAARQLGRMWEDDLCSFTDVTVGICALERLLVQMRQGIAAEDAPVVDPVDASNSATALLTVQPGEQHGFGLLMVQELFRRAGWDVCSGPFATAEGLVAEVRRNSYTLVGISLGDAAALEDCAALIASIRAASRNRNVAIFVGGSAFSDHPERAAHVGADDTAEDGETAVSKAARLLETPLVAPRLDS
ncbi:MAG: cobalamin B12-binding domain-containing protein [Pseudomonadota bacterium]